MQYLHNMHLSHYIKRHTTLSSLLFRLSRSMHASR